MLVRRCAGWLLVGLGVLVGCGDGDDPPTGDTELFVSVTNANSSLAAVEYLLFCTGQAAAEDDLQANGNLELDDRGMWLGIASLPAGPCSVELRGRDSDGALLCTQDDQFTVVGPDPQIDIALACP